MRAAILAAVAVGLTLAGAASLTAAAPPLLEQAERLKAANAEAAAANARARALDRAAADERDAAAKARGREAAVAARIQASEAEIAAAIARVTIVDRLLERQRGRLVERQGPILRLVAALQGFARRPSAVALVQPGSLDDAVHVRALLGTMLPVIARRTAEVRVEIARTRRLADDARLAAAALATSRARLQAERLALVRMEGEHRLRSEQLGRTALFESDRAIAMGERAREIVDLMEAIGTQAETREQLATLPGPLPRPAIPQRAGEPADAARPRFAMPPYRLPAAGEVVAGFGEMSANGVRSRGITLATWAGAQVIAPSAGRVVFARRFRDYGTVVIVDHGNGWSSAITGLGAARTRVGDDLVQGAPVGRAPAGDDARITVELRRRGVPVDLAALL